MLSMEAQGTAGMLLNRVDIVFKAFGQYRGFVGTSESKLPNRAVAIRK
jgi:hypothetical protein